MLATTAQPAGLAQPAYPVALSAQLDPELSSWGWLGKWILAIPHYIVLLVLWLVFAASTVVAGFAVVLTGRYPTSIFDFNVGVIRWTWRVWYYAALGGIGTDQYPPFSLADDPDYPATLTVDYPERLSRRLVLIKWWFLAVPHYVIVLLLLGGSFRWAFRSAYLLGFEPANSGGLLGFLVLIAGATLLFTGRYPQSLFDLIVGFNRWIFRVMAYAALMTDQYPPFRLDLGGSEPAGAPQPLDAD